MDDSVDIEETYTVIADYTRTSVDELDVTVGHLAYIIDDSDEGNILLIIVI